MVIPRTGQPLHPVSGEFVPRVPFVHAEHHVDYTGILAHIDQRRQHVERACAPTARRLAWLAVRQPSHPAAQIDRLAGQLERTLASTAVFGYRQARAELARLRGGKTLSAYQIPDAGLHPTTARGGLDAIRDLIRRRSRKVAADVGAAATARAATVSGGQLPLAVQVQAAALAAGRVLHNSVLELVGETLNLGRAAGVLSLDRPPEYAMRSEQLDANTCEPCDGLHGTIVEIGTADYFDLMPPAGCLGGGRCRGIYVYGDTPADVALAA